jgi:hypothetical protein
MSDFEQQLRRRLTGRAATVAPHGDLDDLVERIAKQRARGRRASAFAMALVVVVGPIGGFALARATTGSAAAKTAAKPVANHLTTTPKFAATPLPQLKPTTQPGLGLANGGSPQISMGINGQGPIMIAGGDVDLGRLFARTSNDGAVLRVYGARISSGQPSVPWFTPAPWCFPDRVVQVDVSNDLVAGVSNGYLTPQPHGDLAASVQFVGLSEHAPIWVAIVQADKGTSVRATFADGGTDSATLDNGVAVLAHRTTATDATTLTGQGLHVELLGSAGDVVADTTVNAQTPGTYDDQSSSQCVAPTTLPAPGAQQPADVAGATAGVTQAFTDVYNGADSDAVKDAAIDDLTGVDAVRSQLRSGPYADEAKGAIAHVTGVVFLSETTAAVSYDIDIAGYSSFTGRLGEAVFTGGRWKVTRGTYCNDVAMAGLTCAPPP